MENRKVYCKYCKYCVGDWDNFFGNKHLCENKNNTIDTPYERRLPRIEDVNKNNNCPYFENKEKWITGN